MSRNITTSDFYCTKCGRKGIPLARKQGQQREPGHLKRLYCLACGEETNHAEVRGIGSAYTKEDFMLEFALGRFVDGNRHPIAELMICKEECPYNVNGRCWNSTHSHDCEIRRDR
jgi:hypothetical protein